MARKSLKRVICITLSISTHSAIKEIAEKYRINKNSVMEEAIKNLIGELEKGMTIQEKIGIEPRKRTNTTISMTLLENIRKKYNLDTNTMIEIGISHLSEKIKNEDIKTILSLKSLKEIKQKPIKKTANLGIYLDEMTKKILTVLSDNLSGLSSGKIAEKTGIESFDLKKMCKKMHNSGILDKFGAGPNLRYAITEYGASILKAANPTRARKKERQR